MCKELKAPSPARENALKLRRNEVTGEVEIKCVFERMDEYLKVCRNNYETAGQKQLSSRTKNRNNIL